jgi:integrase
LLDIVNGTGRRINAVCSLHLDDLRLERTKAAPHGAIVWPSSADKMKRETAAPISPEVRGAVDRMLSGRKAIGHVPLFPAPEDPEKPLCRHTANKWIIEGEKLAGLMRRQCCLSFSARVSCERRSEPVQKPVHVH